MKFVRVHIAGASRLPDERGNLGPRYEVHWTCSEPFLDGHIFAESPEQVWPAIGEDLRDRWRKQPPPDPMFELVGQDRGVDLEGNLVVLGCI